ncbi:MAG: copper-binding protein [Burkholderiales bacterium]
MNAANFLSSVLAAVLVLGAGSALAQMPTDHSKMDHTKAAPAQDSMAQGEVKKIDLQAQSLVLKHGDIKSINMPAMTMSFKVANSAFLTKVKVGDKVRFAADMPNGVLTVTAIELAK